MNALWFFPCVLLLDRLVGEPPQSLHPVCGMGWLAAKAEAGLWRQASPRQHYALGCAAAVLVLLPSVGLAWLLCACAAAFSPAAGWGAAVLCVYCCLAPRSLAEHAQRVYAALVRDDLVAARQAVGMIVGRQTAQLDRQGIARACIESVGENVTDGVLATLWWAGVGLALGSAPLAASLAVLHRSANVLDALWGKRNERYCYFGTAAARLDDVLNYIPARLALPCIALAAWCSPRAQAGAALAVGWRFRHAHESPNSAWSEAAFAGALGLRLGGAVYYGDFFVNHPYFGIGTTAAEPEHIQSAISLMWRSSIVFALLMTALCALWGAG